MGHYAKVLNGKVTQVIVANADFFNTFIDTSPGTWLQTSYGTRGNVHYAPNSDIADGKPPLRGNYAGIGFTYDSVNNVFYAPQPYLSWILDTTTWLWKAPVEMPTTEGNWVWDESTISWVL